MNFSYCSESCLTSVADFPDPSELLSKSNPSSVVKAADTSLVLGGIIFLLPVYGIINSEQYLVFHGI